MLESTFTVLGMIYALIWVIRIVLVGAGVVWWLAQVRAEALFLTHTPQYFKVGSLYYGYRITKIKQFEGTALITGGVAPCWKVYGIKEEGDV